MRGGLFGILGAGGIENMFQLDDAFLQKIGIADWPPEARQRFVDNFRQVLELSLIHI